ncbi:hypothetical protein [uncultured Hymenobacter sp.]|uniref:hypothetical protein n=1 Tax=uncultured Hymenobacter sp. TaxID=170016 RepID=UPI0035CC7DB5
MPPKLKEGSFKGRRGGFGAAFGSEARRFSRGAADSAGAGRGTVARAGRGSLPRLTGED